MSLDVREWLTPKNGKTPAVIVSVAHLDDDERAAAAVCAVVFERADDVGDIRRAASPIVR